MTTLDDPCQGILLEQPTQIDLSRKLQILDEVLQEHGITAESLLYVKGQLISIFPFCVFKSTKKPMKFL